MTGIEDQIIALYAKVVSKREIQDHLQNLYGIEVSPTLIFNITNKIVPSHQGMAEPSHCRASTPSSTWMPSVVDSAG
nr:transposase [Paenibacillus aceti]